MNLVGIVELNPYELKTAIAEIENSHGFTLLDQSVDFIDFTSDLTTDGLIKQNKTLLVVDYLNSFKALCKAKGVERIYAYATSEFKEAKNQRSFVEEIYNLSSIRFEFLTLDSELTYTYSSSLTTLDIPKGLFIYINNTSTNIIYYNRRTILKKVALPIGTTTLANMFTEENYNPQELAKKFGNKFNEYLKEETWLKEIDPETQFVGAGQSFVNLARLSKRLTKYPFNVEHNIRIDNETFNKTYEFIQTLDIDKTKKLKGISSGRADALLAGLAIINEIMKIKDDTTLAISSKTSLNGIALSLEQQTSYEKPLTDILGECLFKINSRQNNYNKNSDNVVSLSLNIFKLLKILHRMPKTYIKVMRIAAALYDSGKRINYNNYLRYSYDIIRDSEINGATHREQLLAAFVVANINPDNFSMTEWVKYSSLFLEEDLENVRKLAVMVKLASLLDRFERKKVLDLTCDILGDSVIFKTICEQGDNCDLEIREALKSRPDFRRVFNKHLDVF